LRYSAGLTFEAGLQKISDGLSRKGTTKNFTQLTERIAFCAERTARPDGQRFRLRPFCGDTQDGVTLVFIQREFAQRFTV